VGTLIACEVGRCYHGRPHRSYDTCILQSGMAILQGYPSSYLALTVLRGWTRVPWRVNDRQARLGDRPEVVESERAEHLFVGGMQ
jgi:hypothetical protein